MGGMLATQSSTDFASGVGRVVKLGPGSAEMSTVKVFYVNSRYHKTSLTYNQVGDRVGIKWISAICDSCRKWDSGFRDNK